MLRVRVDDYPGTKPEEFDKHNLENFKRFHETMGDIPYVLGVIPLHVVDRRQDMEWIRQQPTIEVAQHGVHHIEGPGNENEFGSCPPNLIITQLHKGQKWIGPTRVPITTYIPPHNHLDRRTIQCLSITGFRTILGGPGTYMSAQDDCHDFGIDLYESFPPYFYGRSDELITRGLIMPLWNAAQSESTHFLGLHWTWECNIGFEHLNEYLKILRSEGIL